jgi:glycosyltransferase involved in cell wall biosynthesis
VNNDKLVSVIMPVYNRRHLVGAAADSVLQQTYQEVELVMINDGSTDGSNEVLDDYAARYPGRVKVIHQANAGQVVARNNGIAAAKGRYIAFLDSDDTWLSDKLERQMPLFSEGVGLVYSGIYEIDPDGRVLREVKPEAAMRGNIYHRLLVRNAMTGGSVVVTREALNRVGLFDEALRAAENWDLWIRIARDYHVDFVAAPLVRYLKHEGNISADAGFMSKASEQVNAKHLTGVGEDPAMKKARDQAYAYLHYSSGVFAFGRQNYALARREFRSCWRFVPLYRDSALRYLRSFLGRKGNAYLASLRRGFR